MSLAALEARMLSAAYAKLGNAVVTRGSVSFRAILTQQDAPVFDRHGLAADEVLRYRLIDAPGLAPGEAIQVDSVAYRVVGDPRRIDASEALAQIVRAG